MANDNKFPLVDRNRTLVFMLVSLVSFIYIEDIREIKIKLEAVSAEIASLKTAIAVLETRAPK